MSLDERILSDWKAFGLTEELSFLIVVYDGVLGEHQPFYFHTDKLVKEMVESYADDAPIDATETIIGIYDLNNDKDVTSTFL